MTPKPTEWWLRPVIKAARVGEHNAVEWNCVKRRPAFAMRSRLGVGIRPPKVLGAPKPTSSVMISNTFGAPFGGTTVGGQYGVEVVASRLMTPPKGDGGLGMYRPSSVVVAAGEPGTPLVCWAKAGTAVRTASVTAENTRAQAFMV